MIKFKFSCGNLSEHDQQIVSNGFDRHSKSQSAPQFVKSRLKWLAYTADNTLVGALTADLLWDWIYVDELWVDESLRSKGCGKKLMQQAEEYAASEGLQGIWLWTQSWQAEEFYKQMGYEEFVRFPDFPKGHSRIGFRKQIDIVCLR
jgi:GNAT superfamily N-acetyltransferase